MADGPITPHYLESVSDSPLDLYGNLALRVGEVIEFISPKDERSVSKKVNEYRVLVQHRDVDTGIAVGREYSHCVMVNPFGGLADRMLWTPRIDKGREKDDTGNGKGAKVLMLCVNGEHNSAIILGGVRDEHDDKDLSYSEDSHHFFTEFNGCQFFINSSGEMAFVHNGATDLDGKQVEDTSDTAHSRVDFFKDGRVLLGARNDRNKEGVPETRLEIVPGEGKIKMHADEGIHIGDASEKMAKFSTYRRAEKQLHTTLTSLLTSLTVLVATCAESFKAASTLHVIPIVGPIIAAPAIGALGVQFTAIMALIQAAMQAINSFEGRGSTFESRLNTND